MVTSLNALPGCGAFSFPSNHSPLFWINGGQQVWPYNLCNGETPRAMKQEVPHWSLDFTCLQHRGSQCFVSFPIKQHQLSLPWRVQGGKQNHICRSTCLFQHWNLRMLEMRRLFRNYLAQSIQFANEEPREWCVHIAKITSLELRDE